MEQDPTLFSRVLGAATSRLVTALHEAHGVAVLGGATVTAVEPVPSGGALVWLSKTTSRSEHHHQLLSQTSAPPDGTGSTAVTVAPPSTATPCASCKAVTSPPAAAPTTRENGAGSCSTIVTWKPEVRAAAATSAPMNPPPMTTKQAPDQWQEQTNCYLFKLLCSTFCGSNVEILLLCYCSVFVILLFCYFKSCNFASRSTLVTRRVRARVLSLLGGGRS